MQMSVMISHLTWNKFKQNLKKKSWNMQMKIEIGWRQEDGSSRGWAGDGQAGH